MIVIDNEEYFNDVKEFAKKVNKLESLQENLDYLNTYSDNTKCVLSYDFAPYSFSFTMLKLNKDGEYKRWFNGGLIFHGTHDNGGDGSSPTLSVCLTPINGWSIHT